MTEITKDKLRSEINEIYNELASLAMMGATPLWTSLTARLDDLYERLTGEPYERPEAQP